MRSSSKISFASKYQILITMRKLLFSVLPKGFDESEGFFLPSAARRYPRARSARDLKGGPGVLPREKNYI